MFALQYKDSFLELASAESPVIKWVSTAFNEEDVLMGSGSYPIELANSPANDTLLEFSSHLSNRLARKDIEVTVYLLGEPWKRCTFTYDLSDGKASGHLKIDNGELSTRLKNIDINQVFIITSAGVFVDHEWIFLGSDTDQTKLAIETSLINGAAPYTFFPFVNERLFGTHSGEGEPQYDTDIRIINRWHDAGFKTSSGDPNVIKSNWFCPFLSLTWVIKKACRFLGYEATGDFLDSEFIKSLVIDNNSVYNMMDVYAADGFKIAPARHLPAIKIGDFFKQLRNHFKLVYYFDSGTKKAHFQLSASVISAPERVSLDGCIVKKNLTTQKMEETGYELVQPAVDSDEIFELLPYTKNYFIGESEVPKKVELPISTTFMRYENNEDFTGVPVWRIPYKRQLGNAYGNRAEGSAAHNPTDYGRNKWDLRLLSYQGLQPDADGNDYPYATSDGIATDNVTVLTDSCWLGGSRGILEIYHKMWYIFYLRSERVELSARLTSVKLNELSPLKKIRWATDEGVHLEALMSMVEFVADHRKQLLKAELTVYPFYNQQASDLPGYSNFTGGEIVNPDPIYARLTVVEKDRDYRRKFLGAKVLQQITVDVYVNFYSDPAGTIGKSVSNLTINIAIHTKSATEGNSDELNSVTVGGFTYTDGSEVSFYEKDGAYYTRTWRLAAGDYIILPPL